jgi:hypothetical protein
MLFSAKFRLALVAARYHGNRLFGQVNKSEKVPIFAVITYCIWAISRLTQIILAGLVRILHFALF